MWPDDDAPDRARPAADGCVVLAFSAAEPAPRTERVAAGIASSRDSRLVALRVAGSSVATATVDGAAADDSADWAEALRRDGFEVVASADRDRPAVRAVLDAVERHDAGLVVVPGGTAGGLGARAVERLLAAAPCDVVVVGDRTRESGVASVLAPVAGGPHSGLVADVAGAIAVATGAWIDVLHVVEPDAAAPRRAEAEGYLTGALDRLPADVQADTWLLEGDEPADAIVEQSAYYDLTVVGAPRKGKLRRFLYGSTATAIRRNAENTTVTVHRATGGSAVLDRWL